MRLHICASIVSALLATACATPGGQAAESAAAAENQTVASSQAAGVGAADLAAAVDLARREADKAAQGATQVQAVEQRLAAIQRHRVLCLGADSDYAFRVGGPDSYGSLLRPAGDDSKPAFAAALRRAQPTPGEEFACARDLVAQAAERYRQIANRRQEIVDRASGVSAAGAAGSVLTALTGAGAATQRPWGGVGLGAFLFADLTAAGPRGRLYYTSAQVLSQLVRRYERMVAARAALTAQSLPSQSEILALCGQVAVAEATVDPLKLPEAEAVLAHRQFQALSARCTALSNTRLALQASSDRLGGMDLAAALAADAVRVDDIVVSLDNRLKAGPSDSLSTILTAPLNLLQQAISGEATPPEYTGRALTAFEQPVTFVFERAPIGPTPSAASADLIMDPAVAKIFEKPKYATQKAAIVSALDRLNTWSIALSRGVADLDTFARANDEARLRVDYKSLTEPITIVPNT